MKCACGDCLETVREEPAMCARCATSLNTEERWALNMATRSPCWPEPVMWALEWDLAVIGAARSLTKRRRRARARKRAKDRHAGRPVLAQD